MISTELLRRYPFFAGMTESQLKEIAMLGQETNYTQGATIFEEGQPANTLYILIEGSVDLFFHSKEEYHPTTIKEFFVGEINPGEIFSTSSVIEPHLLIATARAGVNNRVIEIDAVGIRKLMHEDIDLANKLLIQIIRALKDRIMSLRVQLAVQQ